MRRQRSAVCSMSLIAAQQPCSGSSSHAQSESEPLFHVQLSALSHVLRLLLPLHIRFLRCVSPLQHPCSCVVVSAQSLGSSVSSHVQRLLSHESGSSKAAHLLCALDVEPKQQPRPAMSVVVDIVVVGAVDKQRSVSLPTSHSHISFVLHSDGSIYPMHFSLASGALPWQHPKSSASPWAVDHGASVVSVDSVSDCVELDAGAIVVSSSTVPPLAWLVVDGSGGQESGRSTSHWHSSCFMHRIGSSYV